MSKMDKRAEKYRYTPGDPSASDPALREPGYVREKSFRCTYKTMDSAEQVRMGKADSKKMLRVWFFTDRVQFSSGDRVHIKDDIYAISYIPDFAYAGRIDHIDVVRVD